MNIIKIQNKIASRIGRKAIKITYLLIVKAGGG
jgi:hypothetical protein